MARSLDEWRRGEATALPAWVKPQLTKLVDQPPEGPDWLHEIKFDGYRMHARLDRGAVRLLTRTGLDWTHKYSGIASAVASLPARQAYLDGELCGSPAGRHHLLQPDPERIGHGERRGARLFLFDLIHLDGEAISPQPLKDRKERLRALLSEARPPLQFSNHQIGRGRAFYQQACGLKLEGIISKQPDAPYAPGNRGHCTSFSIPIAICRRHIPMAPASRPTRSRLRSPATCRPSDPVHRGAARSSREIPAWMCDAAVCATISSGPPRIAVAALTELRAVLDLCSTGRQSDRSLTPVMTKGGSNETSLDQSTRSRSRSRRHDHVVGTGARRTAARARRAAPPSSRQANQGDPDPTGNM
jgi:ATP dependent DNA ligase domain